VRRELRLCIYIVLWLCMRVCRGVYAVLMPWWIEITCLNQMDNCDRFEYTKSNVVY